MVGIEQDRSHKLQEEALELMPGGVSSPVRAFGAVGRPPFFVASGAGSRLVDVDGNSYIDLVCSWGALLFGHAHPDIVTAVTEAAARGTSFGASTEAEVELARIVSRLVPNAERVRFVSSGTEAAMTAVRLARASTQRDLIVKFAGCYHGHSDPMLVEAGSGVATLGIPGTPGIPDDVAAQTLVVPYNNSEALQQTFDRFGSEIAAVIVEPVAANMGLVLPRDGWLKELRTLTTDASALLILDEVITGFRLGPGGAQERFGISGDIVLLGKILGGGVPAAALAGPAYWLDRLAPAGPVYQAGTLSGNPLAMAAGIATMSLIEADPGLYDRLQETSRALVKALADAADTAGVAIAGTAIGGLAGIFFGDEPVNDFDQARATDGDTYARFFGAMLERGIYLPPSRFEAFFPSTAHTLDDIEAIGRAARDAFAKL